MVGRSIYNSSSLLHHTNTIVHHHHHHHRHQTSLLVDPCLLPSLTKYGFKSKHNT
ncbi:hypothetical protein MtrunA17_Chr3g0079931 [Medicago truncatula]|uniref:Uncharacterized protein n=1 Tax=Medicago truncatula TaxID=3880 RepID=A0A396IJS1_MEDTR|nr:hypothetical protein MtrunA17_Chr3g0079931 [Medicago truncatula]